MKLFFAGNAISANSERFMCEEGVEWRLLSYADIISWSAEAFEFWTSDSAPQRLFLDSGAFGAFTRGQPIDLKAYCEYVKARADRFFPVACLDVIGDWRASAHNWDLMRAEGVNAMPTFHMNS